MRIDREHYPVTALMAERTRHCSKPGRRDDGAKIAVVGQSGAMLGVRLGGMLVGLEAEQVVDAVDEWDGNSAAAHGFAFAKARQSPQGTSIYYQDLTCTNDFINPRNFFSDQGMVNIPFLTYHVMTEKKPLNWERVADPDVPINIYVATARPIETITVSTFHSQADVLDALHLSSRMPVIAGMPCPYNGRYSTDGGTIEGGFPIPRVIDESDPTHILALVTEPEGKLTVKRSLVDWWIAFQLRRQFPELAGVYLNAHTFNYQAALNLLNRTDEDEQLPKIEVIQVPANAASFSRLSKNSELLYQGAVDGYTQVRKRFQEYQLVADDTKYVLK